MLSNQVMERNLQLLQIARGHLFKESARSKQIICLAVDILQLNSPSPCLLRSQPPPPQVGAGNYPLPRSVVPPSRPYPRKRGWDMPARRHPAAEFPLPLLASLAAPSPTSGGGELPPPSLGRSSLPSLPPQAGVGYACP